MIAIADGGRRPDVADVRPEMTKSGDKAMSEEQTDPLYKTKKFGWRLGRLRKACGDLQKQEYSQKIVGDLGQQYPWASISDRQLRRYEAGDVVPKADTLFALIRLYCLRESLSTVLLQLYEDIEQDVERYERLLEDMRNHPEAFRKARNLKEKGKTYAEGGPSGTGV
jgi:hypothetical protein